MEIRYTEINDIPFVFEGFSLKARLVPSEDRTHLVERDLTYGEREWYLYRAEVNECVITREKAEELAWALTAFQTGRFEVMHHPVVKPDKPVYGLYAIFDENQKKFLRPFMTTSEEYAKDYYLELVWGPEERYKLYHIADIDRTNLGKPLSSSDMKYIEIDWWDKHDFMDCRMSRETLKANIEVHFGDTRTLWGLGY